MNFPYYSFRPDFDIISVEKSREVFDFVNQYFETIDYEDYILNDNLYQFGVYDKIRLVGVIIYRMKDGKIHINYTAVHENYRKRGINHLMIKEVMLKGIETDCSMITVNVKSDNTPSLKSFLSCHFNININVKRTYPDGTNQIAMFYPLIY